MNSTSDMIWGYGIKGMIFVLLAAAMFLFIRVIKQYTPVRRLVEKLEDTYIRRQLLAENKKSRLERVLDRMEEELVQAGVKKYLPKAGVEIFLLLNMAEFVLIFFLAGDGILFPLAAAASVVFLNKLLLDILRYRNKKITEKHLLELLNLISDYSLFENEITMILYKTGQMMPEPLYSVLTECHIKAKNAGNPELALSGLRKSIDHFLFQEIMTLLELCSRSDGNYVKVVDGCRRMVNRYLREEKEKMAVVRSLLIEAGIMTVVAFYGISTVLKEFASEAGFGASMGEFFLTHPVGQISLVIYAALIFAMAQVILRFARR